MAVGLAAGRHAVEEEARAEVDVLNSRLEKTTQLTKKIEACLGRLESTGKSVREVVGPLNGETKKLQTFGHSKCSTAWPLLLVAECVNWGTALCWQRRRGTTWAARRR